MSELTNAEISRIKAAPDAVVGAVSGAGYYAGVNLPDPLVPMYVVNRIEVAAINKLTGDPFGGTLIPDGTVVTLVFPAGTAPAQITNGVANYNPNFPDVGDADQWQGIDTLDSNDIIIGADITLIRLRRTSNRYVEELPSRQVIKPAGIRKIAFGTTTVTALSTVDLGAPLTRFHTERVSIDGFVTDAVAGLIVQAGPATAGVGMWYELTATENEFQPRANNTTASDKTLEWVIYGYTP